MLAGAYVTAILVCGCESGTSELQQAVQNLRSTDETTRRAGMEYFIAQGPGASEALPDLLAMVPRLETRLEVYPALAAVLGDRQVERGEWMQLLASLHSAEARDRWTAAWQLGYLGFPDAQGADEATRKALEETLDDRDPRVRSMALWGLIAVARGSDAIRDALRIEFWSWRRNTRLPSPLPESVEQELFRRASDPDAAVRLIALEPFLLDLPLANAVHDLFLGALADDDSEVRSLAVLALYLSWEYVPPPDADLAVAKLIPQLQDPREGTRVLAASALTLLGSAASPAVRELTNLLSDTSPNVRSAAALCLESVGPGAVGAEAALLPLLDDSDAYVRRAAVGALGKIGGQARLPEILRLLEEDPSEVVAAACLEALGEIGRSDQRAVSALMERLRSDTPDSLLIPTALSLVRLLDTEALRDLSTATLIELMESPNPSSAVGVACLVARIAAARSDSELGRQALKCLMVELVVPSYDSYLLSAAVSSVGDLTTVDGLPQELSSAAEALEEMLLDETVLPPREKELRATTVKVLERIREYLRRDH